MICSGNGKERVGRATPDGGGMFCRSPLAARVRQAARANTGAGWFAAGAILFSALYGLLPLLPAAEVPASAGQKQRSETTADYYRKWLTQDVVYIIAEEEKKVFEKLTTAEEKEKFIEQFWFRRDPDPNTAVNEFKEEHYRRIAYANERFSVGQPGWMSDRGRIYVIHGPPAQIESHPAGGHYSRPSWRGGGFTQTYPFEVWRYRYIEGIGSDVEVEFVDRRLTGQYQIATSPEQKDALLQVGRSGPTLAEMLRRERKGDRPYFSPINSGDRFQRMQDTPFERYATFVRLQQAPKLKFPDLRELVKVNISYQNFPLKVRPDYFRLNEEQVLVPITVEIENKDLTFKDAEGGRTANVAVYGVLSTINNRIVEEFEDELDTLYSPSEFGRAATEKSIYQKVVVLDRPSRCKLDLIVKDLNGNRVGVVHQLVAPPAFDPGKLAASSLLLSDFIEQVDETGKENQMFLLGNVWIHPSLNNIFSPRKPMGAYLQVYNAAADPLTQSPSLSIEYRISKGNKALWGLSDQSGDSVRFYSDRRIVIIRELPVADLAAGIYRLDVTVQDRIKGEKLTTGETFSVAAP